MNDGFQFAEKLAFGWCGASSAAIESAFSVRASTPEAAEASLQQTVLPPRRLFFQTDFRPEKDFDAR
jgi:hypothetical protein